MEMNKLHMIFPTLYWNRIIVEYLLTQLLSPKAISAMQYLICKQNSGLSGCPNYLHKLPLKSTKAPSTRGTPLISALLLITTLWLTLN